MTRPVEGFRSDDVRSALVDALAGRPARLEQLLSGVGLVRGGQPSLALAQAFGVEVAALPGELSSLLTRLGNEEAAPDSPRVYLPIVAAHGWAGRVRGGKEVERAWAALAELAADWRGPVRLGTLDALSLLSASEGGADTLLERALSWLEHDDREQRLATAALVLEVLADRQVLSRLSDAAVLLDYLVRITADIADAPRAAERWEGRRRALRSLPNAMAAAVAFLQGGDRGLEWLVAQCGEATHPDVREALSRAIVLLAKERTLSHRVIDTARSALEASAKPLRDPTLMRPGTGRGRRTRPMR